jgi:hypothetical protein
MSYLRSQIGDFPGEPQELDREIDEAFGDFKVEDEEFLEDEMVVDETVAMPEDSDSGNEVINITIKYN